MNTAKALLTGIAGAAVMSCGAVSCPSSGATLGASIKAGFRKIKMDVPKKGISEELQRLIDEATKPFKQAVQALADNHQAIKQTAVEADRCLVNFFNGISAEDWEYIGGCLSATYQGQVPGVETGSLGHMALATGWHREAPAAGQNPLRIFFAALIELDPSLLQVAYIKERVRGRIQVPQGTFVKAITRVIKKGELDAFYPQGADGEVLLFQDRGLVRHGDRGGLAVIRPFTVGAVGLPTPAAMRGFLATQGTFHAVETQVYTILDTVVNSVKDDLGPTALSIFFPKGDKNARMLKIGTIFKNLGHVGDTVMGQACDRLNLDDEGRIQKKATGFGIAVNGGYLWWIDQFMLGLEAEVELPFGGTVKVKANKDVCPDTKVKKNKKDKKDKKKATENGVTVKKVFAGYFGPTIGFLFNDRFTLALKGGISIQRFKVDTTNALPQVLVKEVIDLTEEYFKSSGAKDQGTAAQIKAGFAGVFKKHKVNKLMPFVGGELGFRVTPNDVIYLGGKFILPTKIAKVEKHGVNMKLQEWIIEVGYRRHF
ncbi:MAG: hypothetical protein LBI20_00040 [Holosporales bacterium]|nr:hypothetical protein [Holosporales bacterium]